MYLVCCCALSIPKQHRGSSEVNVFAQKILAMVTTLTSCGTDSHITKASSATASQLNIIMQTGIWFNYCCCCCGNESCLSLDGVTSSLVELMMPLGTVSATAICIHAVLPGVQERWSVVKAIEETVVNGCMQQLA
jgi:hypothetical protein